MENGMNTIRKFRILWAWEDEKEEAWLREMSNQGWHLKSVSFPGFFTFSKGEPSDYVYRLDYFTNQKDSDNYLQIFEDAGWEYLGKMNYWQYFRKEVVNNEPAEIYTDRDTKVVKFTQILTLFSALFVIFFPGLLYSVNRSQTNGIQSIVAIVAIPLMAFYIYAMINLMKRIKRG